MASHLVMCYISEAVDGNDEKQMRPMNYNRALMCYPTGAAHSAAQFQYNLYDNLPVGLFVD
jgi:hypothetical protein